MLKALVKTRLEMERKEKERKNHEKKEQNAGVCRLENAGVSWASIFAGL